LGIGILKTPSVLGSKTSGFHPGVASLKHQFPHRFDWNEYLGSNGKSFVDGHDAEATPFVNKFRTYAQGNLTGDEAEDFQGVSAPKAQRKLSKLKPDIVFNRNSKREALLPIDCLDLKLEDKKHVFRSFLKSQYGESS
jgi:hypothetical protein